MQKYLKHIFEMDFCALFHVSVLLWLIEPNKSDLRNNLSNQFYELHQQIHSEGWLKRMIHSPSLIISHEEDVKIYSE